MTIHLLFPFVQQEDTACMRDLESFKRLLGSEIEQYTEAQLQELHRQMYAMADLLLDLYLSQMEGNPKR